jgi:hypothetical protein
MNNFIQTVTEAHSVVTAYKEGAVTLAELRVRTGLPFSEIAFWCNAFSLPLKTHERSMLGLQFSFRGKRNPLEEI